jgi:ornithine cyclodeaminase/alanine dehydrogenase-like protein (mu-crystallin family)
LKFLSKETLEGLTVSMAEVVAAMEHLPRWCLVKTGCICFINRPRIALDADLINGDMTELVSGKVSGRSNEAERTAFVFRSVALGDLAVAALAYQKLCARGAEFSS